MSWMSPYFTSEEMQCSHTGLELMDAEFMEMLTELRVRYAKPLVVTSAYRHPSHPIEARKSKPGAHTTGKAVDLGVQYGDAYTILGIALTMGFTGIGVQQKGSGRFIHLDTCTEQNGFPRPTIWSY
jgi:zinc D-Ala-D-Ala carboxypeptidase